MAPLAAAATQAMRSPMRWRQENLPGGAFHSHMADCKSPGVPPQGPRRVLGDISNTIAGQGGTPRSATKKPCASFGQFTPSRSPQQPFAVFQDSCNAANSPQMPQLPALGGSAATPPPRRAKATPASRQGLPPVDFILEPQAGHRPPMQCPEGFGTTRTFGDDLARFSNLGAAGDVAMWHLSPSPGDHGDSVYGGSGIAMLRDSWAGLQLSPLRLPSAAPISVFSLGDEDSDVEMG